MVSSRRTTRLDLPRVLLHSGLEAVTSRIKMINEMVLAATRMLSDWEVLEIEFEQVMKRRFDLVVIGNRSSIRMMRG